MKILPSDEKQPDERPPAIVKVEMPSSSERLNLNINTLLTISERLRPYLADPESGIEGVVPATKKAREAAEDTFVQACAQIQLLVAERRFWDPELSDKIVDAHMKDLNKFNLDAAERRLAVMKHAARLSVMMGCRVKRSGDQIFAYLTGGSDEHETFWATGATLNEALDNLDRQLS